MKIFVITLFLILSTVFVLSNVSAQSADPSLPNSDGLLIEFKPGTTLQQADELRVKYGLQFAFYPFPNNSGGFLYEPTSDFGYEQYADFFYRSRYSHGKFPTKCWEDDSCPPILVTLAVYDPVSSSTARQLLGEPIVDQVANNPVFFWIKPTWDWLIEQWVRHAPKS